MYESESPIIVEFNLPFETEPFDFPIQQRGAAVSADKAYEMVIASAGDYTHIGYHDQRIIDEVVNRTGRQINSQRELIQAVEDLYGPDDPINPVYPLVPLDAGIAPLDTDQDGMPDEWETKNGLNASDPEDRNGDQDGDGYTNLEEYLNSFFDSEVTGIEDSETLPEKFALQQNYPNPFNPITTIRYSIPVNSRKYVVGSRQMTAYRNQNSDKRFQNQASSIKHQASSIKHRASSIKHRASSIKHRASSIKHRASSIKHRASSIEHRASSIQNQVFVSLKIYDILGREVAILVNEHQQPGEYEVIFNASKLSSGLYIYSLNAGGFISTRKMIFLK